MENLNKTRIVRILRIIGPIIGLITIIVIPPLDLVPAWIAPLPDTVQEQVDEAIDYGLDGIIVYVDQAGEAPQFYAAGWNNKLTQVPADPHAFFKIGSIHKLYIATAVAKLVSEGSLSLEGTLADYLPELVGRIEYADQITLRMLVQHRSGIPNFTDDSEFDWFTPLTDEEKALELVLDDPADFKPDTDYSYSNTNYLLLGRILDRVLGYSHHQYVYNEILAPLGLMHTFFTLDEVAYDDVVSGYWYEYDDDLRNLGGSMVATAEDVGIFLRALNDGSLLNDDEQAIYASIYEYDHDGWVPGYHSMARYHEDIDTVVVQFVSTTGGETWGTANVVGGKATGISSIIYNRIVRILRQ
ncbi:MAG: beta-lactamase family protein [Ardenticatenaceae bacterium]|nr:beta-lactamase family protein [Anaerolineales bacterium]MCB8940351.1 beta-lactamase family protein [Ardenticatenaceae bacterium]MCB8973367.1 beta-lactamase family protein [Ardenticatenaceae bacterium]